MTSIAPRNLGGTLAPVDALEKQIRLLLSPEELEQQAAADFRVARAFLLGLFPFLGRALGSVAPVQASGLGTMAVDKHWRLYYDPALWDRCSRVEIAAMIMHEVEHLLGRHSQRAAAVLGYEPPPPSQQNPALKRLLKKMNIAMDYAIHGRKGWTRDNVPRWGVFPDKDELPLSSICLSCLTMRMRMRMRMAAMGVGVGVGVAASLGASPAVVAPALVSPMSGSLVILARPVPGLGRTSKNKCSRALLRISKRPKKVGASKGRAQVTGPNGLTSFWRPARCPGRRLLLR